LAQLFSLGCITFMDTPPPIIAGSIYVLIFAGFTLLLSSPILVLGRKRIHWQLWELSVFVLPYAIWVSLFFSNIEPKSDLNMAVETVFMILSVLVAVLARVIIEARFPERLCAAVLICLLCVVDVVIYFAVPNPHDSI